MSEISDAIQAKCLAFGDRIIRLNDYLLKEAANVSSGNSKIKLRIKDIRDFRVCVRLMKAAAKPSDFIRLTSYILTVG